MVNEKFRHIDKNMSLDHFVWRRKSKVWHHPYFHHVMVWVPVIACSVIRKDFVTRYGWEHILTRYDSEHIVFRYDSEHTVTRYDWEHIVTRYDSKHIVTRYDSEHIYLCALSGMLCCLMRICQASSLNATWDKQLLLTNVSVIYSTKCRPLYTIMWFKVLKNFVIHNTAVTNVLCQSGCGMPSSLLACLVISVYSHFSSSEASWTFSFVAETVTVHLLLVPSISGWSCTYVLHSTLSKYYYI